jgi:chemotaxis protein CheD
MTKASNSIDVSMSEMAVQSSGHVLRSIGIGSCVVITLYDHVKKIGAMAHPMMPATAAALDASDVSILLRFIEPAIEAMIRELEGLGGVKSRFQAKLFGGAHMFQVFDSDSEAVGIRNIAAAKRKLEQEGIDIVGNDTGGNIGRSVAFDINTGIAEVKTKI